VRNFFNEEVAYGRALLVATDSIQREVLEILAATLQTYPPVPDILLKLHEDIVAAFGALSSDGRLDLVESTLQRDRTAFMASVAWRIPMSVAATVGIAQSHQIPVLCVAGERYESYQRLSGNVSGLEIRLLQ
jgi:hypothetical protein